ncbi:MAG TPA: hypothetical protein VGT41_06145 [Candidatus Babeliales bacterium]|nr:hypothetical protein [Candidatus Babeliales bacterium]
MHTQVYKNCFRMLIFFNTITTAQQAIVIVPVTDLAGSPIEKSQLYTYENLPLDALDRRCPRIHQLLFNETVEVLEHKDDQARISIPNLYYETANGTKKYTTYWVQKKHLLDFDTLQKKQYPIDTIPTPIDFKNKKHHTNEQQIVTLHTPFYDSKNKICYSAGTRFVQAPEQNNPEKISVYILNPKKVSCSIQAIPKHLCIVANHLSKQEKIDMFITILRSWCCNSNTFIPYVWGGCSFTQRYPNESFVTEKIATNTSYYYPQIDKKSIKMGMDCSNMIAQSAQIVGMPFYFKNSFTILKALTPISQEDDLEPGDIIWIPGHLLVVADIANNTLIEASSYLHGDGRIQEIPISRVFHSINTYQQLKQAHLLKKKLQRINTLTHVVETPQLSVVLLKMSSIWDNENPST